jgi:hypothetical protein
MRGLSPCNTCCSSTVGIRHSHFVDSQANQTPNANNIKTTGRNKPEGRFDVVVMSPAQGADWQTFERSHTTLSLVLPVVARWERFSAAIWSTVQGHTRILLPISTSTCYSSTVVLRYSYAYEHAQHTFQFARSTGVFHEGF